MGLVSLLSPVKIRRDAEACIDCGKCARACPAQLPVDQLVQIRSAECTACMACVAVCSTQNALQLALAPSKSAELSHRWTRCVVGPVAVVSTLAGIFLALAIYARATGHWETTLSREVYLELVPHANDVTHPGM